MATFEYSRAPTGELSGESLVRQTEQSLSALSDVAEQTQQAAEDAQTAATQAQSAAESAQSAASNAVTTAQAASQAAATAAATAQDAQTVAGNALTTAQNAASTATNAVTAAEAAQAAAKDAAEDAADSADLARQSADDAAGAQTAAESAKTAAESAQTSAGQAVTTAQQAQQSANQAAQEAQAAEAAVSASARQIGEIVTSTLPLSSAGLHLLDGSVLPGGIYAAFVSYIANLYALKGLLAWVYNDGVDDHIVYTKTWTIEADTPLYNSDGTAYTGADFAIVASGDDYVIQYSGTDTTYTQSEDIPAAYFCSEAAWQTSVTTYGVCGKFVYDRANGSVRLPKITGIIEVTVDATALGDLVQAGLPNITGTFLSPESPSYPSTGAFDWSHPEVITGAVGAMFGIAQHSFDASRISPIYGNSSTVQPQTVKCFVYIVIATVTKTEIQVDIGEITTDLNGKADTDLSNAVPSQSFKDASIGWGMPDYTAGISVSAGTFTPSKDGFLIGELYKAGSVVVTSGSAELIGLYSSLNTDEAGTRTCSCPVNRGESCSVILASGGAGSTQALHFYPVKGE